MARDVMSSTSRAHENDFGLVDNYFVWHADLAALLQLLHPVMLSGNCRRQAGQGMQDVIS